jgi:hypothetical protein
MGSKLDPVARKREKARRAAKEARLRREKAAAAAQPAPAAKK